MAPPCASEHDLPAEFLALLATRLEHQARSIGQRLHDGADQILAAAYLTLAEATVDLPADASGRLAELRRQLDGVEEQLRQLAHELKPVALGENGLPRMLAVLAAGARARHGLDVRVETDLERPLPADVELVLYRVVQEALTNVGHHARATEALVHVASDARSAQCVVRDNGLGFDVHSTLRQPGLGLIGIREKLSLVGGHLHLSSVPGAGAELIASIPLEQP